MFSSSNGNFDIQKDHINGKGSYVVTAGLTDNGILGKTDVDAKIFDEHTITVDMFGFAFYRQFKYKLVTHARVFSLKPSFEISKNQGLFLSNSLRFLNRKFGYENMCSWGKIKNICIKLPVKNSKIDFEFMEKFIAELETERVAELSAYLKISGLDNYELSNEEKEVLDEYDKISYKDFNILKIFEVKNTKNILSRDVIVNSGTTPYLCARADNNSISSYIDYKKDLIDKGNCIFIGGKTFVVTYQKNDFYSNDSHNLGLYLKEENYKNKLVHLFLATCVRKSLSHKYSWGDSVSKAKIKGDNISLPVINEKVVYDKMQIFISAIQKLVIKDVVDYVDKKIELTKKVIKN